MAAIQTIQTGAGLPAGATPGVTADLEAIFGGSQQGAAAFSQADGQDQQSLNAFASQLAVALSSKEAEAVSPEISQPVQQPALTEGQNLPFDPMFKNAIEASFAALVGLIKEGDLQQATPEGQAPGLVEVASVNLQPVTGELAVEIAAQQAAAIQNQTDPALLAQPVMQMQTQVAVASQSEVPGQSSQQINALVQNQNLQQTPAMVQGQLQGQPAQAESQVQAVVPAQISQSQQASIAGQANVSEQPNASQQFVQLQSSANLQPQTEAGIDQSVQIAGAQSSQQTRAGLVPSGSALAATNQANTANQVPTGQTMQLTEPETIAALAQQPGAGQAQASPLANAQGQAPTPLAAPIAQTPQAASQAPQPVAKESDAAVTQPVTIQAQAQQSAQIVQQAGQLPSAALAAAQPLVAQTESPKAQVAQVASVAVDPSEPTVAQRALAVGSAEGRFEQTGEQGNPSQDKSTQWQLTSAQAQPAGEAGLVGTSRITADVAAPGQSSQANAVSGDIRSGQAATQQEAMSRAEARVEASRASLGSGPLNVEILRLTRQGGGRAVLEVTPPNQGPIRLDLQLDGAGKALLVVEGLTDAMRGRLESTAGFLRQDMASLGLTLNLEMRQGERDSGGFFAAQDFGQQFGQPGGSTRLSGSTVVADIDSSSEESLATKRGIANDGPMSVNLYA